LAGSGNRSSFAKGRIAVDQDLWLAETNIERYEQLLRREPDEAKRKGIVKLLAEEQQRKAEMESRRR